MTHTPVPAIILICPTPSMGQIVPRRGPRPWSVPKNPRLPRWSKPSPIPSFDRRALRERVTRLLEQTEQQRNGLKAASHSHLWCLQ